MHTYIAAFIWWTALTSLVVTTLWVLAGDVLLIKRGLPSITDYLRSQPWAFWGPLILLAAALGCLMVHLFSRVMDGH